MSFVTTHVLDTATGRPAAGITVTLTAPDGTELALAETDADGRIADFGPDALPTGDYTVTFDTAAYATASGATAFYPRIAITVHLDESERHYHVPLLLSPFGYSTYRGS